MTIMRQMNKLGGVAKVLLLGVGLALVAPAPASVEARPKQVKKEKRSDKDEQNSNAAPAELPKAPRLKPKGLRYGMSPKQVARIYDRAIDEDYSARRREVQPGVEMERLQYEIEQRKLEFRQSLEAFDGKPNRLDATPFVGEFSNNNGEASMRITRRGRTRHLFFIQNKLWKTIDVYALEDGGKWGADFATAIKGIQKILKVEGRVLPVDEEAKRKYPEVDWADFRTHLRVMNWGKQLAIGYVDRRIEAKLVTLRRNKPKKDSDVDAETKKVLR